MCECIDLLQQKMENLSPGSLRLEKKVSMEKIAHIKLS